MPFETYPFETKPLAYAYNALEPVIDRETMEYHHNKHYKGYVDKLNKALEKYPYLQKMTLEDLLRLPYQLPPSEKINILRNSGGVYNHLCFFDMLVPKEQAEEPKGKLLEGMNRQFGSYEKFKEKFTESAESVFGSGWSFLIMDRGMLRIITGKDQETTMAKGIAPIILMDVWEHAYYLQYKNNRKSYIEKLWSLIQFPSEKDNGKQD